MLSAVLFSGCAGDGESRADYKNAKNMPALEVPPDLLAPQVVTPGISAAPAAPRENLASPTEAARLPTLPTGTQLDIRVERDGALRWLVVKATPPLLWPQIEAFLIAQGLQIERADPRLRFMETAWTQNTVAQNERTSFFRRTFGAWFADSTQDKYRVRLEDGPQEGSSEIHLTHLGLQKVTRNDTVAWELSPPTPAVEDEMLKKLAYFLSGDTAVGASVAQQTQHAPAARVTMAADGGALVLNFPYANAWRRLNKAVDELDWQIIEHDRTQGSYHVRAKLVGVDAAKKGIFARFFDRGQAGEYRLHLTNQGAQTRLAVVTADGAPDTSSGAQVLLQKLLEYLK